MITNDHPGIGALVLDVADPASVARAAEAVAASHPGLNVLVNNAGIRDQGSAALLRREPARAVRDAEADGRYGDLLAMLGNVG